MIEGERTERELALQAELDAAKAMSKAALEKLKERETRIAVVEDENRQLKTVTLQAGDPDVYFFNPRRKRK